LSTGTRAIGSNSFVSSQLGRGALSKPNVVFRFRQNFALLQPRLDIFLDYLDKLVALRIRARKLDIEYSLRAIAEEPLRA
jgi:hypothetical protein